MEFEFIRDPDLDASGKGFQVDFSHEHRIVGRWLIEEFGIDLDALQNIFDVMSDISAGKVEDKFILGKEVSLRLNRYEALIEANSLHQEEHDLSVFADDALELDDNGLSAGCGFEDFLDMLEAWRDFVIDNSRKRRR
ncbi:YacL family protein [Pseudoalteromonas denitrificans]|uniref:Uncharacterized protein n=1 Tax=Pseudoalteromonas denitrificans DSM 6059 TaxID=1123010 RepID=A0A1I1R2F9_9GAMM|nr:YacL family protein [Pseudoalteromonas denitrificans]SFD28581.1 hypothetical protein SAMN02745724_04084 [Pseudoalteromonas denitrificans DSM 6059]